MQSAAADLSDTYHDLGIQLRKNVGRFPVWTAREHTIVDLDEEERRILEREGEQALDDYLRERGMFPVPALDIRNLRPIQRRTCLGHPDGALAAIYVPDVPHLQRAAETLNQALAERGCRPLEVLPADEFALPHLERLDAVILGGAHQSPAAALLCDLYWLDADLRVPGPGGWLLRTVHSPAGLARNVLHLCADETSADRAVQALIAALQPGEHRCLFADHLMQVHPGPELSEKLGDFEHWREHFIGLVSRGLTEEHLALAPADMTDLEAFMDWLAEGYDSGGPEGDRYNRGPMGVAMRAARLYLFSGDARYLALFKGLVWRLIDYHCNFPGGASYLSDYDFEVQSLALYWSLLEAEEAFSDAERLVITNFLLASLRMVDGYRAERWPTEPGTLRHNHETFPALSLYFGGRYFEDYYDLPEAGRWLITARETFSGPIETAFKHREDANSYQWMVPLHKLVYDTATERDGYLRNGVLGRIADNVLATTDNLGWPSDFGDAGRPIGAGTLPVALLEYAAGRLRDPGLQWHADRISEAMPDARISLTGFLGEFFGPRRIEPARPADPPAVTVIELDDHIRQATAPQFPQQYTFDKLALRDGWGPEGDYLLVDGYSLGSHFHYDQNAIIRFTCGGRLWLVDNGYGKRSGESRAGIAFSRRERGPQDHNTLLVYEEEERLALPNPLSALLTNTSHGPLTLVQSAQVGYGRVDWLRTIVWLCGSFLLVVDQANAMAPVHELRCQLNMLGAVHLDPGQLVCDQRGGRMVLQFEGDSEPVLGSYSNGSWDDAFAAGHYPWADPPIAKFERVRRPEVGDCALFVTLIETGERRCDLSVSGESVSVNGPIVESAAALTGHGASVELGEGRLVLRVTSPWPVPDDIPLLRATQDGKGYAPLEEWFR